ncbi:MAG TPA: RDD family protein [Solirubrobacteraceae bacterium]|nr:RDD family protein [Solirubrobacteraceae bacterium]
MSAPPATPQAGAPGRPSFEDQARYVGLVTRAVAMVIDAALINVAATIVGVGVGLILALIHPPQKLDVVIGAIGAAVYVLWTVGYFVSFWAGTGQTPGMRLMQIRVLTARGDRVKPRRGVVRCVGLVLAALPLFAGFVPIIFDRRRRGFQDHLAHTVVVEAPQLSVAAMRRARRRADYDASRRLPPPAPG